MDQIKEDTVAEQTPGGQDLARIALRNAIQGARRNRGRSGRPRSRWGARPGGPQPVPLRVTVAEVADHFDWPVAVETAVVTQWPMIVGDLAMGLVAVRFDPGSGVLSLRGASPAWATMGRFRSKKIMHAVNQALGQQAVREIAILPPAPPPAPALPVPQAFRHADPGPQDDEQMIIAARQRQAAQAPREPRHLFTPGDARQAAQGELVRARALARARAERAARS